MFFVKCNNFDAKNAACGAALTLGDLRVEMVPAYKQVCSRPGPLWYCFPPVTTPNYRVRGQSHVSHQLTLGQQSISCWQTLGGPAGGQPCHFLPSGECDFDKNEHTCELERE